METQLMLQRPKVPVASLMLVAVLCLAQKVLCLIGVFGVSPCSAANIIVLETLAIQQYQSAPTNSVLCCSDCSLGRSCSMLFTRNTSSRFVRHLAIPRQIFLAPQYACLRKRCFC